MTTTSPSGATSTGAPPKERPPEAWTCFEVYFSDGACDCGCGAPDPDCPDATLDPCEFCGPTLEGYCVMTESFECGDVELAQLNPLDNSTCLADEKNTD